jgi:hypothetical protein
MWRAAEDTDDVSTSLTGSFITTIGLDWMDDV